MLEVVPGCVTSAASTFAFFVRFLREVVRAAETVGNYLDKIEKLSIINYGPGGEPLTLGEMVVEVSWLDEDGKPLEKLVLTRSDDNGKATYIARSGASRLPGEVNRSTATQIERDLDVLFGD